MSQYRLHIDVPLGSSEEEAIQKTQKLMNLLLLSENTKSDIQNLGIDQINYRLGYDDDRQKSNYLIKNENGHVSNKKCKADYNNSE